MTNTISGAGNVNLTNGTLTFTTAQPYTGVTTITSGTLALSGSGSIANSASLANSGTFDISATGGTSIKALTGSGNVVLGAETLTITAGSGIFSGVISGTGALTMSGGSEVLSGTNTYTGGTTVTAGTLQIGAGATTGSVVGNIADFGTVAFDYANSQAFAGVISGTGAVTLISGTLSFSTVQSYTGLTTVTSGTLALMPGGDISASKGLVANGTFDISQTSGTTIGSLSGQGIVQLGGQTLTIANASGNFSGLIESTGASATPGGVIINSGTQILSGTSTYTGTTLISTGATLSLTSLNTLATSPIVDNGTLDISSAINNLSNVVTVNVTSLNGSGSVTLGSSILIVTNASGTFSGVISGTGGLTISGGTQTLTGGNSNTFTGATVIASGATLILSGSGSLPASTITADGTLDMSGASGSATFASLSGSGTVKLGANSITLNNAADNFSGVISGSGGLTVSGGTQILGGANTYTGGTSVTSGATLQLGDGGTGGTVAGNIAVGSTSTLAFDYSGSTTFAGTISGAGGVNQLGGTLVLTGANNYSGGTTITSGTLELGNGGSITGNVTDNGTLAFNQTGSVTYGGTISGTGGVSQLGTGTLLLSAVNSYTGTTAIASGATLQIGAGNSIAASGSVADNGAFDVSGTASPQIRSLSGTGTVSLGAQTLQITNGAGSFSGVISGTGGVSVGGGTQTLAGTSNYSGATTVGGGTLAVTGSIASSSGVAVSSGGTLSGTGTVPGVTVASGGTIAPGSGGSWNAQCQWIGLLCQWRQFPDQRLFHHFAAAGGVGSANLGGTVSVESTNGTLSGRPEDDRPDRGRRRQRQLHRCASDRNRRRRAIHAPGLPGRQRRLSDRQACRNCRRLLASGSTLNQTNAVAGIDAGIAHGDNLPQAFENLGNVSSSALGSGRPAAGGRAGWRHSPGRQYPVQSVPGCGVRPSGRYRRPAAQRAARGPADRSRRLARPSGGHQCRGGRRAVDGAQKFSSSAVGFAGGGDWQLSPSIVLGGALSLGSTHFHIGSGLGTGQGNRLSVRCLWPGQYTPRIFGAFMGAIGEDSITTSRSVSATENETLSGSLTSQIYDLRYETGINLGWMTPYIGIEDRLLDAPAYTETGPSGANSFALSYASRSVNMPDVEFGFRNAADLPVNRNWVLHLTDKFAFEHTANSSFDVAGGLRRAAGSDFTTFGAQPGKNVVRASLGAEFKSRYGLTAGLTFEEAVSSRSQSYKASSRSAMAGKARWPCEAGQTASRIFGSSFLALRIRRLTGHAVKSSPGKGCNRSCSPRSCGACVPSHTFQSSGWMMTGICLHRGAIISLVSVVRSAKQAMRSPSGEVQMSQTPASVMTCRLASATAKGWPSVSRHS